MKNTQKNRILRLVGAIVFCMPMFMGCRGTNDYVDTAFTAEIDSLFNSLIASDGPGAMVVITHNDSTLFSKGYGLARLDTKTPIDENTLFSMASATKLFTTVGVMKLVEEGCVELNTPLSKLFPKLSNDIFNRVKVSDVLSGSSGLPNQLPKNPAEWEAYRNKYESIFFKDRDFNLYGNDMELTRFLEGVDTLLYEPGTSCPQGVVPSDPPFMLMSQLIEDMTHTDYSQWMFENILKPGGVDRAYYSAQDVEDIKSMSHGYVPAGTVPGNTKAKRSNNGKWEEYDDGEVPFFRSKGDSGLFLSAKSYKSWRRHMFDGSIVSKSAVDSIYYPRVPVAGLDSIYHGLGVIIIDKPGISKKRCMRGYRGGYASVVTWFPAEKISYFIFMNRNDIDVNELMSKIEHVFARHQMIKWVE